MPLSAASVQSECAREAASLSDSEADTRDHSKPKTVVDLFLAAFHLGMYCTVMIAVRVPPPPPQQLLCFVSSSTSNTTYPPTASVQPLRFLTLSHDDSVSLQLCVFHPTALTTASSINSG